MKLANWALISEIAGGIAVVLSVIYLAGQISDNNRLLRSQAHYYALALAQGPIEMLVDNEGQTQFPSNTFGRSPDIGGFDPILKLHLTNPFSRMSALVFRRASESPSNV